MKLWVELNIFWNKYTLYGFLRLRISNSEPQQNLYDVLHNRGLIRELHIYGKVLHIKTYKLHKNLRNKIFVYIIKKCLYIIVNYVFLVRN